MAVKVVPINLRAANEYVRSNHRHHGPSQGHKFSIAVEDDGRLCGVAIVGRQVARHNDNGRTLKVVRLCSDGTPNACSALYAAARRAAKALGYRRILTYVLASESGTSLKASGWVCTGEVKGRSWDTPSRRRTDKHSTVDKIRWEAAL